MNHDSTSEIRATLLERGLTLKKRWGQNFLVNRGARERIVALLGIRPGERVWEIGPGLGSMTELLLAAARELTVFEVDRGLCRWLEECFGGKPGFGLVSGDFVETWRNARDLQGPPERLLGNLPYRSASLMIMEMVEGGLRPASAVFTVQRELADRMTSQPGGKNYSSFTVLCQSCFEIEDRGDLKPGSFYPVPEVVSSIIELRPRLDAPEGSTLSVLSGLARGLFSSRRKTLRNNAAALTGGEGEPLAPSRVLAAFERAGINPGMRAEQVSPGAYVAMARYLTRSEAP
jgi:16S rRNA (adenine1518-N6/adenine1519-N6)-dimethyltransferase